MSRRSLAAVFSVFSVIAVSATPATAQTAPRTAWGQPDLGGIWDFRTITPLQRPVDLADQAFLTEEEAANLEQQEVEKNIPPPEPSRRAYGGGQPGGLAERRNTRLLQQFLA